jgi:hypothetical protein
MVDLRLEKVESEVHGTMFVLFEHGELMRPIALYPKNYLERDLKILGYEIREIPKTDAPSVENCSICGADYEDRCEHNPSHTFKPEQDGFTSGEGD